MSKQIGRKVEAAIGLESSRGVGVAPAYSLGKIDFSVFDKTVDARQTESLGHIADSADKYVVEKYAQGSMSGHLGANTAAYLLALAFGGAVSTGSPTDSVYPHTIPLDNDNVHQSGALLVKDADRTLMHKLLMLESFNMEVTLEDIVSWDAEFISKLAVTSTQSIPTYVEDYKFTKRKAKIYVADDISGLAAASALSLKQFSLSINKNVMRDSSIGTVEPEDILNREISIEGQLRLNYTDETFKNYMLDASRKALRISLESEKLIGSTTYGSIEIDLPKVDFFSWEPDAGLSDIITQQINFKANYDLTDGLVESVTVSNALTTI